MSPTYVIGHVNPDTDSIASAIGYAWFLGESEGGEIIPARAGAINPQTTWVLNKLGIDPPTLLTDASPRFESVARRLDTAEPDSPLREAWAILTRTGGIVPIVNRENGIPFGLITGFSLFKYLSKYVGPHPRSQEMRIAELLDLPSREACDTKVPKFQASTRIRDVINRILREEHNEFIIVDEQGVYLGVARQRDVLNPPRIRIILVDHNEPGQSLGAVEEAELVEILDHHRLGNMSTHIPIRFSVDIVGSTSTLVAERIEDAGLSAPPHIAGVLLAGLLSDTLIFTSPTTTDRDHQAAERLARWSFIPSGPLAGETIETFGEQVINAGAVLATREPDEIVNTDLKMYEAGVYKFAIAQVEVTDLVQLSEMQADLLSALKSLREKNGLNFKALFMELD